jgi:hypothetical protein
MGGSYRLVRHRAMSLITFASMRVNEFEIEQASYLLSPLADRR